MNASFGLRFVIFWQRTDLWADQYVHVHSPIGIFLCSMETAIVWSAKKKTLKTTARLSWMSKVEAAWAAVASGPTAATATAATKVIR